jgi:hypothetical protein
MKKREQIPASELKAIPPPPDGEDRRWLGSMSGTGQVDGDVLAPAEPEDGWETLQP